MLRSGVDLVGALGCARSEHDVCEHGRETGDA